MRKKEQQAQLLEEQRQKFKEKTSGLLKFSGIPEKETRTSKPGRKKKEQSGDIYSEGEGEGQRSTGKKRRRLMSSELVISCICVTFSLSHQIP